MTDNSVFEKAHAPTDDEREALDYLNEMNEAGRIEYDDYRNLHDLISGDPQGPEYVEVGHPSGERQPVEPQGEPSGGVR